MTEPTELKKQNDLSYKRECFSNLAVKVLKASEKYEVDPFDIMQEVMESEDCEEIESLIEKYDLI